jgi:hypothetical protein
MTNLKPIKKGATYIWRLKFWQDSAKTIPLDISQHNFSLVATNSAGTTVITLTNTSFVEMSTQERKVTIPAATTNGYAAGEVYYQLDVTLPDTTVEEWMNGYINIII